MNGLITAMKNVYIFSKRYIFYIAIIAMDLLNMKLFCCVLLCFWAAYSLEGCGSQYDYYTVKNNIDRVVVKSASWKSADSALLEFIKKENLYDAYYFRNYTPLSSELKTKSEDSLSNVVLVSGTLNKSNEPFSISLSIVFDGNPNDYYNGRTLNSILVEIYGCSDFNCKNAQKVIVRNDDYSDVKLLNKGEFEILDPSTSFYSREDGYDCDVTKQYHFRLKVEKKDFLFDMDVQKGGEECQQRDIKCIFC